MGLCLKRLYVQGTIWSLVCGLFLLLKKKATNHIYVY